MILKPPSDREQKVTSPILLAALQRCSCPWKGYYGITCINPLAPELDI
jgi:hypothetical protein